MHRRSFSAAILTALIAAFAITTPAGAQDADDVFERLKQKYESIGALRAEFMQTMSSTYMDEQASSTGVLVASGDSYRVETSDQTLVTDGTVTWVYMPSQNQLVINDHSEDEQAFSVSDFLFDYDERFEVAGLETTTIDGDRHHILTLEPGTDEAFFTEATLTVRARDDIITRLQVVDVNGTTMVFDLTNIELNPSLDADVFRFDPPEGTEIIDLRS